MFPIRLIEVQKQANSNNKFLVSKIKYPLCWFQKSTESSKIKHLNFLFHFSAQLHYHIRQPLRWSLKLTPFYVVKVEYCLEAFYQSKYLHTDIKCKTPMLFVREVNAMSFAYTNKLISSASSTCKLTKAKSDKNE